MSRPDFYIEILGTCEAYRGQALNPNCNVPLAGFPSDPVSRIASEVSVGVTRPKPEGWLEPTPYSFKKVNSTLQRGSWELVWPGFSDPGCNYGLRYYGVVGGGNVKARFDGPHYLNRPVADTTLFERTVDLAAKTGVNARARIKNQSVNLGVAFGERKQTARLIGDTATRLFKSLRHLRSGRIRRAMDELGISSRRNQPRGSNVPKKWLELQYGWKPLLSECYGSVDALTQRPAGDWRVTAKSAKKLAVSEEEVIPSNQIASGICRVEGELVAFTRVDALPQNEALISLSSLGVTNPLLVGWELVPFSFVVDWFAPIGSYLSDLDALLGYDASNTWTSVSRFMKVKYTHTGQDGYYGGPYYIKASYTGTKDVVQLDRVVSSGLYGVTFPRFKDPRSLGHMANGLALLAGFFGR